MYHSELYVLVHGIVYGTRVSHADLAYIFPFPYCEVKTHWKHTTSFHGTDVLRQPLVPGLEGFHQVGVVLEQGNIM